MNNIDKKYLFPAIFGFVGFFISYFFFGNLFGIDISLKMIFFGLKTGNEYVDLVSDYAFNAVRNRIWIGTLVSIIIGFILGIYLDKKRGY